jgi:hypothetical protein
MRLCMRQMSLQGTRISLAQAIARYAPMATGGQAGSGVGANNVSSMHEVG